jgi:flagellar motor protein MotB
MVEPAAAPKSAGDDRNVGLFLAFYLLLLAFFIVLYSISQPEEVRTDAAINSLTATFQAERLSSDEAPQYTSSSGPFDPVENFHNQVRGLFARDLRVARFEILQFGNTLRVSVPSEALFVPGRAQLREQRTALMEALADALSRESSEGLFEVELIVGAGAKLPTAGAAPSLTMRRAAALARDLRARGVPARALSAGLRAGNAKGVEMFFLGPRGGQSGITFEQLAE